MRERLFLNGFPDEEKNPQRRSPLFDQFRRGPDLGVAYTQMWDPSAHSVRKAGESRFDDLAKAARLEHFKDVLGTEKVRSCIFLRRAVCLGPTRRGHFHVGREGNTGDHLFSGYGLCTPSLPLVRV